MTNPTAGVRLGGGGYSYGDYVSPTSKPPAPYDEDQDSGKKKSGLGKDDGWGFLGDKEVEVFLFTIRDPVRTVVSKLMDLLSVYGPASIPKIDIQLSDTGPLGYTTIHAFRPIANKPDEPILKPVVR